MKILVLPLFVTFLPIILLVLILKYWVGNRNISIAVRIALCVLFLAMSFLTTFYAVIISISGMAENQVQFMTGAIIFILPRLLNVIGAPLLLFSKRKKVYK